jgi:hypothetical protein
VELTRCLRGPLAACDVGGVIWLIQQVLQHRERALPKTVSRGDQLQLRMHEECRMRDLRPVGSWAWKASVFRMALLVVLTFAIDLHAEEQLHDPALPTVSSEALHQLLDKRTRQKIMAERQSHFPGRCVCQFQTTDSNGRSCKGRHEIVKGKLQPLCYPRQVSQEMVDEWRHFHR